MKADKAIIEEFFVNTDEFGYSPDVAANGGDLHDVEFMRSVFEPCLHQALTKQREEFIVELTKLNDRAEYHSKDFGEVGIYVKLRYLSSFIRSLIRTLNNDL